jgi:hypothetical protein
MGRAQASRTSQTLPRTFLTPNSGLAHRILVLFGSHPEFAERHWSQT